MKKIIAVTLALMILSTTSTAYASPKADPVEVLRGDREIITELDSAPQFYAWGIWKTPTYNRVQCSDGSEGYILSNKRLYFWMPADGRRELYTSPADWLRAVMRYQRERYAQEIDGAPLPLRNGNDFSWHVLGVCDYIEAWEDIYKIYLIRKE